jgi:hypothetical protein
VEPTSAAILTIGCALIGGGLGGLFAAGVIQELQWDPITNGFTIKGKSASDGAISTWPILLLRASSRPIHRQLYARRSTAPDK